MEIKRKRKTKTVLFSTMLICLFILSFGLNVKAADDPIMTVVHVRNYTPADYPINVHVNFEWGTGINRQLLTRVDLYYSVNKAIIGEDRVVSYVYSIFVDFKRPLTVIMEIPSSALVAGDVIRFKVDATYIKQGDEKTLSSAKYSIKIQEQSWEEQGNLIMIIGVSAGVALFVVIVLLIYAFRRRR